MDGDIYQVLPGGKLQRIVLAAHLAVGRQPSRHKAREIGVVTTDLGAIRSVPGDTEDEILRRLVDGVANTEAAGAATRHQS